MIVTALPMSPCSLAEIFIAVTEFRSYTVTVAAAVVLGGSIILVGMTIHMTGGRPGKKSRVHHHSINVSI